MNTSRGLCDDLHDADDPSTMSCISCGHRLPDAARFCDQCGARQQTTGERAGTPGPATWGAPALPLAQPPSASWEYCEVISIATGSSFSFQAMSTGPMGWDVVDQVSKMPHDEPSKTNQRFLTHLVTRLIAAGWEPQPTGAAWYALRFRRHVIP